MNKANILYIIREFGCDIVFTILADISVGIDTLLTDNIISRSSQYICIIPVVTLLLRTHLQAAPHESLGGHCQVWLLTPNHFWQEIFTN